MKTEVLRLEKTPSPEIIKRAAEYLIAGKLVVFPTETVYGIGALPDDSATLKKIYDLKGRSSEKPFSWHLSDPIEIARLDLEKNPLFEKVADKYYPGPLTALVRTKKNEVVGIRVPEDPTARALIRRAGGAILATSANPSGKPSARSAEEVLKYFDGRVDLVLDGGPTKHQGDSTLVDFAAVPFKILRPGVYSNLKRELEKMAQAAAKKKNILVVCTGNTCRSPMAAGWLRTELKRHGLGEKIEVDSCGIFARKGVPPSFEADLVLKSELIDVSDYRSKPISKELVDAAHRIVVMADEHREAILELYPEADAKICVLKVNDPIGKDLHIYKECLEEIKEAIKGEWAWLTTE